MLKNIGIVATGNIFAQAIQLGALLILSRIYLPDDFGALAQVQSLATILAILATPTRSPARYSHRAACFR